MTRHFKSYEEYGSWTELFESCDDFMDIPVCIDTGNKVECSGTFKGRKPQTALKKFAAAFAGAFPEFGVWIETMKEMADAEEFEEHYRDDFDGSSYSFNMEEYSGEWYIYLNVKGCYTGR